MKNNKNKLILLLLSIAVLSSNFSQAMDLNKTVDETKEYLHLPSAKEKNESQGKYQSSPSINTVDIYDLTGLPKPNIETVSKFEKPASVSSKITKYSYKKTKGGFESSIIKNGKTTAYYGNGKPNSFMKQSFQRAKTGYGAFNSSMSMMSHATNFAKNLDSACKRADNDDSDFNVWLDVTVNTTIDVLPPTALV